MQDWPLITQAINGSAVATSDQVSDIDQGSYEPVDTDTASTDDDDLAGSGLPSAPAADDTTP